MTQKTLALNFFLWNTDRAMNPVLRGKEDLPQDYLSDFYIKALNHRQTLNFISRDKTGNRESWFILVTEHAGTKQQISWQIKDFFLCHHLWIFLGVTPLFDEEGNSLCTVVTSLSSRSTRLNPRPVHVENMVDTVETEEVFLRHFWFNPVITIPPTLHSHSLICHRRHITCHRRYITFAIDGSLINTFKHYPE
jgi:hypothetical protein